MARAKKENPAPVEERNFEKDLEDLEAIVNALEEGGLSLDESLKRFEQGIRLARCCEKTLTEAEKKIEILTRNAQGQLEPEPFDEETGAAPQSDASGVRSGAAPGAEDGAEAENEDRLLF